MAFLVRAVAVSNRKAELLLTRASKDIFKAWKVTSRQHDNNKYKIGFLAQGYFVTVENKFQIFFLSYSASWLKNGNSTLYAVKSWHYNVG